MKVKYVIITPVRNEEQHLPATLASVCSQSIQPARWIIVDDGSTDGTNRIADEAARQQEWIKVLHRESLGPRLAGAGVMAAFYAGIKSLGAESWQYLVKLDGDVTFERDYFENCFAHFAAEPRLGIAGGLICNSVNGSLCPESKEDPPFHVRGATKIYRYECWQAIGGLIQVAGWDTVDELRANMLGWTTRTLPDIPIVHHRPAGGAYGAWSNWIKNGYANYVSRYHPLFMLLKCVKRLIQKPYGIAALALWVGFCRGHIKRAWRVEDQEFVRYFHRQQMLRLLGRPSLWD
jgi:biofilm PGA synthesis N-glycosyltransferase PgaC